MADASAVSGELRSLLRGVLAAAAASTAGPAPAEEARAVDGLRAMQRLKLTTQVSSFAARGAGSHGPYA